MVLRALSAGTVLALTLAACSGGAPEAEQASASEAAAVSAPIEQEAEPNIAAVAEPAADEQAPVAEAAKVAEATKVAEAVVAPAAKPPAPPVTAPVAEVIKVAELSPPDAYARCATCHTANKGGEDKLGPNLYGVFRSAAGQGGFSYSSALKESGLTWDEATLHKWLENPRALVPGNRMSFPGIKDPGKRQEIIDYLKQQS